MADPRMLAAYGRWMCSKMICRTTPRLTLPGGSKVGEWLSFSEYWSFKNIIPVAERLFIERHLSAESGGLTAFDIGANLGAFTCLMASQGHSLHSFEPIPETFCRFKKNVKFNGLLNRAHLNCLAVGKEQGLVTFHIQEDSPATNRMAPPGDALNKPGTSTQIVAAVTLDQYCSTQGIEHIDFVKIDVEGMEPYVLQGAKRLLEERRIAAILIEICPTNLYSVGLSPAVLYREFEIARYSPFVIMPDGTPGEKLTLKEVEAMSLDNIALLPDV